LNTLLEGSGTADIVAYLEEGGHPGHVFEVYTLPFFLLYGNSERNLCYCLKFKNSMEVEFLPEKPPSFLPRPSTEWMRHIRYGR
jgi:hypothetical protein